MSKTGTYVAQAPIFPPKYFLYTKRHVAPRRSLSAVGCAVLFAVRVCKVRRRNTHQMPLDFMPHPNQPQSLTRSLKSSCSLRSPRGRPVLKRGLAAATVCDGTAGRGHGHPRSRRGRKGRRPAAAATVVGPTLFSLLCLLLPPRRVRRPSCSSGFMLTQSSTSGRIAPRRHRRDPRRVQFPAATCP